MIIATAAVYAAIAVTMYVNGSYAWSKGGNPADQIAMLCLALAIDGCKCSFLRLSSYCRQDGRMLAAVLAFLLWWPCLGYSTFAGYSYLHTNRTTATSSKQGVAEERQRAKASHDKAADELKLAASDPLWTATSACTSPKPKSKSFCDAVDRLRTVQADAAAVLDRVAPTDANPEVTGLAANTGFTPERVQFLIAVVPAVLVELLASVGFYALGKRSAPKPRRTLVGAILKPWRSDPVADTKTAPATSLAASRPLDGKGVNVTPVQAPSPPVIKWSFPG